MQTRMPSVHRGCRFFVVAALVCASAGSGLAQTSGSATEAPVAAPAEGQAAPEAGTSYPRVRIGGLWYLALQVGEEANLPHSRFAIKRGYLNVNADIFPYLSARFTPDVYYDDDGVEVRIKFAYALFKRDRLGFIWQPGIEMGVAHTPWLDFEEQVNRYRVQDGMFVERSGLYNSADLGFTVAGLLGGVLPDDVRARTGGHHPGRYGSFAFGLYNGGGYAGLETNDNKVFEARLTVRPVPEVVPGLQASYSLIRGKGNTAAAPDWRHDLLFVSWEHRQSVLTAQWVSGEGNQRGSLVDAVTGRSLPHRGWSIFGEARFRPEWSALGRVEQFDGDTRVPEGVVTRLIGGLVRHLGRGNMVLVDVDRVTYGQTGRPRDVRVQFLLQVSF